MRDFFADLRLMLADTDLERMGLGTVVHQFIQKEAIPRIQKKLDGARTDNDKVRYVSLLTEYEKYSDPRSAEAGVYSKTAANIVRQLAQRSRIDEDSMEDLMQQIALEFFKQLRAGGNDLMHSLGKFNEDGGPLALNKYWASIVDMRTRWHIREAQRKYQEQTFQRQEGDEGDEIDPISQIVAPSQVDEGRVRASIKALSRYMHSTLSNPKFKAMFDIWFRLAQTKGANMVDMKHDVFPIVVDRGYVSNYSTFNEQWIGIKRIILSFFEKELGEEYIPVVKRILHLSVAESLTITMYRRRLAAWMLGGVLQKALGL